MSREHRSSGTYSVIPMPQELAEGLINAVKERYGIEYTKGGLALPESDRPIDEFGTPSPRRAAFASGLNHEIHSIVASPSSGSSPSEIAKQSDVSVKSTLFDEGTHLHNMFVSPSTQEHVPPNRVHFLTNLGNVDQREYLPITTSDYFSQGGAGIADLLRQHVRKGYADTGSGVTSLAHPSAIAHNRDILKPLLDYRSRAGHMSSQFRGQGSPNPLEQRDRDVFTDVANTVFLSHVITPSEEGGHGFWMNARLHVPTGSLDTGGTFFGKTELTGDVRRLNRAFTQDPDNPQVSWGA